MTTVTIGSYPTAPRPPEPPAPAPERERREAEEPAAFAPVQKEKETEKAADDASAREVRVFSAPSAVRRRLPLRAVFAVRLLLAAGAAAFLWLGGTFGSAELRAAIAEAVGRALHG